jgi:hypothetical protein
LSFLTGETVITLIADTHAQANHFFLPVFPVVGNEGYRLLTCSSTNKSGGQTSGPLMLVRMSSIIRPWKASMAVWII